MIRRGQLQWVLFWAWFLTANPGLFWVWIGSLAFL